ncbi:MAG: antitoxin MazE family protein [Deltaproteobacteria bacterium]|nr:antitoxin MazE family protein [Deltaproteobacteria bacterium]MBF0527410.1 antitoxin MazE family protein [Deltaproteobacteria bacterium]
MTPGQKMRQYRQRLRLSGLRPIQIWVPDTRSPALVEELRRQSLLAGAGPDEQATLDFLEDAADWDDWK